VDQFCAGGDLVGKSPDRAFRLTLQAAERGYVPAQEVVGMMYAIGKGVPQDYREAAKWFLTAAEAGNTRAATNYVGSLRSGTPSLRTDPELTAALGEVSHGPSGVFSGPRPMTLRIPHRLRANARRV
jgi:TPR repeat protein